MARTRRKTSAAASAAGSKRPSERDTDDDSSGCGSDGSDDDCLYYPPSSGDEGSDSDDDLGWCDDDSDNEEDMNKKPKAKGIVCKKGSKPAKRRTKKMSRHQPKKEEAEVKTRTEFEQHRTSYMYSDYMQGRETGEQALIKRLAALIKKGLTKCVRKDEFFVFFLERGRRRFGPGDVNSTANDFATMVVRALEMKDAARMIEYYEELDRKNLLGEEHTLSVDERISPFKDFVLDCSTSDGRPTDEDCPDGGAYCMLVEPKDAQAAGSAVLKEAEGLSDDFMYSERNMNTANALATADSFVKSFSYKGETKNDWRKRAGQNFNGYASNKCLHHCLKSGHFRIIFLPLAEPHTSSKVSSKIKKAACLAIEMVWHVLSEGVGIQGERGSLCKVFGGGNSWFGLMTRLYLGLENDVIPGIQWRHDLDENGSDRYLLQVQDAATNKSTKDIKLPDLRQSLRYRGFAAVIPSGDAVQNAINDEIQEMNEAFTKIIGGAGGGGCWISKGALLYFHSEFQRGAVQNLFRIASTGDAVPFEHRSSLADEVVTAYESSNKARLWSGKSKKVIAKNLANLTARIVDCSIGTLAGEIERILPGNNANASSDEEDEEEKAKRAAMEAMLLV